MTSANQVDLCDALQRLGIPRVEAHLVAFLRDNDDASTPDVMEATGLRQPEVSVGMRGLAARGWVAVEQVPREGKGRPMNRYKRRVDPSPMRGHYADHAKRAMASLERALRDVQARLA